MCYLQHFSLAVIIIRTGKRTSILALGVLSVCCGGVDIFVLNLAHVG
jgi:hypothetical protein